VPAPPPFARLDFPPSPARPAGAAGIGTAREVLIAHEAHEVGPLLDAVDAHAAAGRHAIGYVAYEAAPAFDPAAVVRPGATGPLAWFLIADTLEAAPPLATADEVPAPTWTPRRDAAAHAAAITGVREAIARGDVYQVNHTERLDVTGLGDPAALYAALLTAQGPGYGAHLHTGTHEILSASPELFVARRGDLAWTQPMKGTARRGRWAAEDEARATALRSSPKERAENVMIVDLLRNDLGRVAEPGAVRVPSLFDVEHRPTVLQMTSTVEATLRPGTSTRALFAALFPCGSVTGAPKLAAMAHIARSEDAPRGVYCGAIGHVGPGECTFSVAIRTLAIDHARRRAVYGVGSGVTWDSDPAAEHDELLAKAAVLTARRPAFALLETMRAEGGVVQRREAHLARLSASAAYFGWDVARVRAAAERALDSLGAGWRQQPAGPAADATASAASRSIAPAMRVRLTVDAEGATTLRSEPAPAPPDAPPLVVIATTPVDPEDVFLCHKTTRRAVYDAQRAAHPDAWDVLLWNSRGELTESTIGNLVLELDGARVTPARSSGLLNGVLRDELLAQGAIAERVLTRDDLARATRVWVINALRGWVEVRVVA
jgi:para-aminobenzoate synthetase / 4-amino-4-deoxychorismate lyase